MRGVETILFLVVLGTVVAAFAGRLRVPAPSLLVIAGLVVALLPRFPPVHVPPDVVSLVVLPPLLYAASEELPWRDLRAVWRPVTVLAVGLVLASAAAVAAVTWAVAAVPVSMAFVLGSVLASTDPSTKAMLTGTAATAQVTAATAAADASTRPTARTVTGRHTARRSRHGSSSLAAYNSGGSTTKLTTSGGTWTGGNLGSRATTSPAITSKDGAGTRSRPAKAATTVPSTTRNKMVSTPRMPLTSPVQPTGWVPTRLPGAPPPAYPSQLSALRLPVRRTGKSQRGYWGRVIRETGGL